MVPGVAAGLDDGVVGFVDAVGEMVLAQELPDVFLGVQLRAVGRQEQQGDVVWQPQTIAGLVPTGAVEGLTTAWAPGATQVLISARCRFMASMLA